MTLRASTSVGEDARAATRALFGLSLGVGGMAAAAGALIGDPLAIVALPALALAGSLARGAVAPAGYAAAVVWLAFLPRVSAEAVLVPLTMTLACLAMAIGPERLQRWARRHEAAVADVNEGWIEER
jgi:hypothetical protein